MFLYIWMWLYSQQVGNIRFLCNYKTYNLHDLYLQEKSRRRRTIGRATQGGETWSEKVIKRINPIRFVKILNLSSFVKIWLNGLDTSLSQDLNHNGARGKK